MAGPIRAIRDYEKLIARFPPLSRFSMIELMDVYLRIEHHLRTTATVRDWVDYVRWVHNRGRP